MPKRFTNTDKWHKKWFRNLSIEGKILFLFLLDACDNAGFYEMDIELMHFFTKLSEQKINELLNDDYFQKDVIQKDGWLWIKDFIGHQKNLPLSPKNNYHKQIIGLLYEQQERFAECKIIIPLDSSPNINPERKIEKSSNKIPFNIFWDLYRKKVGHKDKVKKKWNRLSKKVQEEILKYIPKYIEAQPNKKYRKNPETFLNNNAWEDELISHKTEANVHLNAREL